MVALSICLFVAVSTAWAQQVTPADFYAARDRARQALGWTSNGCPGRPDLKKEEVAALQARLEVELDAGVITMDGWMAPFAFLPVDRPADVDAVTVFLGTGGNGDLFWPPRLLSIYLRKGDRVLIADAALATKFGALEACDALRQESVDAFNDCWVKRGRDQPAFAAALRQARALVDELAAR